MSEHITHVAIFEDGYRLMQLSASQFPKAFVRSLEGHYDHGIVCCGTRGNHTYAVPIVEKYRGLAPEDYSEEGLQQLAGALGWMSHRAADSTLNPLADQVDERQNPMFNGQDLKLYYEVVVMKEVYQSGQRTTASPYEVLSPATLAERLRTNPAAQLVNIRPFETLFTNYYLREFLGLMHVTASDAPDDLDAYLTDLVDHAQYFQENLSLYTAAYEHPDPMKMQEFVYHLNFYNRQDPLIRLLEQLRNGDTASPTDINQALQATDQTCQYARAVQLNYAFWRALAAYYEGNTERASLQKQLLM